MAELKESYQEKLENTFEMYKDALKDHAYQRALERVEDDYVPLEEFIAEQEKVEVLDTHFRRLTRSCHNHLIKLSDMNSVNLGSDLQCLHLLTYFP